MASPPPRSAAAAAGVVTPAQQPEPTRMLLSLTSWCDDIRLSSPDSVIGRSESCHAVINLPHISSRHCRIIVTSDGKTQIQDQSSNGTFVNARRLTSQRFEEIVNGDTVSLTPPGERSVEAVGFVFQVCDSAASSSSRSASPFPSTLISRDLHNFDLNIIKRLGRGSFGEVYLGVKNHAKYAVKVVKKGKLADQRLFEEVRVMERLKYPHIVQIDKVWDSPDRIIISLEFASGGDLEQLLQVHSRFGELDSKSLIVQVLNALKYLHANRVIHRDLKPENVLLKYPISDQKMIPHLLLTDFGMSRMFDHSHTSSLRARTICGTPNYVAYEVVRTAAASTGNTNNAGYDEKVDLWSAGVMLYRIINGCLPWKQHAHVVSLTDQIVLRADPKTPVDMVCDELTPACRQFVRGLIVRPELRMTAEQAMQHDWISGVRRQLAIPASMEQATQGLDSAAAAGEEEEEDAAAAAAPVTTTTTTPQQQQWRMTRRTTKDGDDGDDDATAALDQGSGGGASQHRKRARNSH